jgi:hypothetical protein
MVGQTFTELKNKILSNIYNDSNIIKSLVMHGENFLTDIPDTEQQYYLDNPEKLLRKQIFPYKSISLNSVDKIPYITSAFYNFKKVKSKFIFGTVTFFIIIPVALDKTSEGQRYDVIGDMLENLFSDSGIGEFEFKSRGDVELGTTEFQGHSVSFDITDFHWKDD